MTVTALALKICSILALLVSAAIFSYTKVVAIVGVGASLALVLLLFAYMLDGGLPRE